MGLAGPRKRTKISHDPNNTSWSRSTTNFGHKILTAQGWAPGTLLGAKNAPHAQFHSAASAFHIRVALKDDNLGLGARRGTGQAEGECTGLSAFQGLLGRLNGKTEEEAGDEQKAREGIRREMGVEKRWGLIRFVKGGFLVGDKIEELIGDRTYRGDETEGRSANRDRLSRGREGGGTKKKDSGDSDDQGWHTGNNPKAIQVQGEEAKIRGDKARSRGSDDSGSSGLKARDARKCSAKDTESHKTTTAAVAQPSTISDLSLSERGECERKVRRLKRRARKVIKCQNMKGQTIESGGNQLPSLQHPSLDVASAELKEKCASATAPTDIPRGRHVVRQRYIQQKKKALLDAQALNEILMIKA
ncbi:MAG: telomerase inhibitor [Geoglossum simile]|nr:MAG: telomerase inhibitor [Geoglossum simile]